jgi:hypothetical protein
VFPVKRESGGPWALHKAYGSHYFRGDGSSHGFQKG